MLFLLHGFVNLQRELYINEIFSLFGWVILIAILAKSKIKKDRPDYQIFQFILYGIILALIGFYFNKDGTTYEKLRTLPILYSIACFYLGYYVLYEGLQRFCKSKFYSLFVTSFVIIGALLGPKISYPAMFVLISGGYRSRKTLYLSAFFITLSMLFIKLNFLNDSHNDLTVVVALLVLVSFFFFRPVYYGVFLNRKTPVFGFMVLFFFLMLLKIIHSQWSGFYYYGNEYFSVLSDPNAIWRLMFWAKTVGELSAYQWVFGIGLGTPIFDPNDPASMFIVMSEPHALHRPYTLGLHNSFITFFVRFGLIGTFLLCCLLFNVLRKLSKFDDLQSETLILSLIIMIIAALFNVVLESALYSGLFWSVVGISYAKATDSLHKERSFDLIKP